MSSRMGDIGDEEVRRLLDRIYQRLLRARQEEAVVKRLRRVSSIEEFQKTVSTGRPVVVVFTSPMCPGCQMYKPMVEEAAAHLPDVEFLEVDAYELPDLAWQYGVMSLPTTIIFIDGRPVDGFMGVMEPGDLVRYIRQVLARHGGEHVHRVGEEGE